MAETPKKRGRPRRFQDHEVIEKATETFLRLGYAGTSLNHLTAAVGLNKPSLYAAFGDKRTLFKRALQELIATLVHRFHAAFERGDTLESSLAAMLLEAVDIYTTEQTGCLVVSVSATEAIADPGLARHARDFFADCDRGLEAWIQERYAPPGPIGAKALAPIVNGIIHDISVRARVGESAPQLRDYARVTATTLATAAKHSSPDDDNERA